MSRGIRMSADNGWSEYSKLVLKELSTLANNIESLNNEIQELKQEIARMREREDRVEELRNWKDKEFKTKSVTVFMVVQFLMGVAVALSKFLE